MLKKIYKLIFVSILASCFLGGCGKPRSLVFVNGLQINEKWQLTLDTELSSVSMSSDSLMLLVRTSNALYAIDSQSGTLLWKVNLQFDFSPTYAVEANGVVCLIDNRELIALQSKTGLELWRTPLAEEGGRITSVSGTSLLVNQVSESIQAYELSTGKLLWDVSTGRGPVNAFTDNMTVYILDDGILAVDLKTGKELWKRGNERINGLLQSRYIYYASTENVYAFNLISQVNEWKTTLSQSGSRKLYTAENYLFVCDNDVIYALDDKSGIVVWKALLNGASNLSVFKGYLVVWEGYKGDILFLNLDTGEVAAAIDVTGSKFSITSSQRVLTGEDALFFINDNKIYSYFLTFH